MLLYTHKDDSFIFCRGFAEFYTKRCKKREPVEGNTLYVYVYFTLYSMHSIV